MKIPILGMLWTYVQLFIKNKYIGVSRFTLLILSILSSTIVEGIGLSAVIPLINIAVSEAYPTDRVSLFFNNIFQKIGIDMTFLNIVLFIMMIFFLKFVIVSSQNFYQSHVVTTFSRQLRSVLVGQYCKINYIYFTQSNAGHLMNVTNTESKRYVSAFRYFLMFLTSFISFLTYAAFACVLNISFSIIIIGIGLTLYLTFYKIRKKVAGLSIELTQLNREGQSYLLQLFDNYKYLKSTAQLFLMQEKLFTNFRNTKKVSFETAVLNFLPKNFVDLFALALVLSLFYYFLAVKEQTFAQIVVPLIFMNRTFSSFTALQDRWQRFLSLTGSLWEVEKFQKQFVTHEENDKGQVCKSLKRSIRFDDVSFAFKKKVIISNVTLEIPAYSCIGIAGRSGSGKTTLLDLLAGLLDPTAGTIYFDDDNYSSIRKKSIRKKIGYITQEPVIFNDTIANNITLWEKKDDSRHVEEKMLNSSRVAYCDEFIDRIRLGYSEIIGDKGVRLSGGQRQRISIAREIFRDREILVFDEATASLDSKSERYIQDCIRQLVGIKTMIIVAHRLSTLRTCDKIYVMENGSIVESDSWDNLVKDESSLFHNMVREQIGSS